MPTPFLGEIKICSFNFAPKGWAMCNGQLLPINQNQALFSLLGTTYGGNGQTTFALPNLEGRVPTHLGSGLTEGEAGGEESHTLTLAETPTHTHLLQGSTAQGTTASPTGNVPGTSSGNAYVQQNLQSAVALAAASVTSVGGGQAHENRQPFLTLNFCIALQGVFPSRN